MKKITKNQIKHIRFLNQTKGRNQFNEFFIEGKRLVESAIQCKTYIKKIYLTEKFLISDNFYQELDKSYRVKVIITSNKTFQKISNTKNPSGIAAICNLVKNKLKTLMSTKLLYLNEISDPGNLGTIIRSAVYFNFMDILLSRNCVDPYNPKTVRSGMGAHFKANLYTNVELNTLKSNYTLIGADMSGQSYKKIKIPDKFILVLGSEAHGLQKEFLKFLDITVSIKKTGFGESLNVSSAGSILMNYLSEK
jgi:TrmH family RNA methyltransferase